MRFILFLLLLAASTAAGAQHAGPELVSMDKKSDHHTVIAPGVVISAPVNQPATVKSPLSVASDRPASPQPVLYHNGKTASHVQVDAAMPGVAIYHGSTAAQTTQPPVSKPVEDRPVFHIPKGKTADTTLLRQGIVIVK